MEAISVDAFALCYNELEDRIKLTAKVAGDEVMSFWLTRRLSLRLLDAAVDLLQQTSTRVANTPYEHKNAMALFEHQVAHLNATEPGISKARRDNSPVDVSIDILRRLDIGCLKKRYKLSFFLNNGDAAVATSVLTSDELHQMIYLIHTASNSLGWGVDKLLFTTEDEQARVLQ